jgi:hypothetical protein
MRAIVLLLYDIHIVHTILLRLKGVTTIESSAHG